MKYLGDETKVEVKTKSVRKVEYLRCDGCSKKIIPAEFITEENSYVRIHTWHNDWGNDSVDSHVYKDLCKECTKFFVMKYVDEMSGTDELEMEHRNLSSSETYENYEKYDRGYTLAEEDKR